LLQPVSNSSLVSFPSWFASACAQFATKEAALACARALDLDVFDRDMVDDLLGELHCRAWPDATTRPARLVIEQHADPRE